MWDQMALNVTLHGSGGIEGQRDVRVLRPTLLNPHYDSAVRFWRHAFEDGPHVAPIRLEDPDFFRKHDRRGSSRAEAPRKIGVAPRSYQHGASIGSERDRIVGGRSDADSGQWRSRQAPIAKRKVRHEETRGDRHGSAGLSPSTKTSAMALATMHKRNVTLHIPNSEAL